MTDKAKADQFKAEGNTAFTAGNFEKAVELFSSAIACDGTNHVLFSNRSGAYAGMKDYKKALEDADKCIAIKPDWAKGYSRRGAAHFFLGNLEEAEQAYKAGLEIEPANASLKQGLQDVAAAIASAGSMPLSDAFKQIFAPQNLQQLLVHPTTRKYMQEPDFQLIMADVVKNPSSMSKYLQDPRFSAVLNVLLSSAGAAEEEEANAGHGHAHDGSEGHGHSHDGSEGHGHSHGPAKPSTSASASKPAAAAAPAPAASEPVTEEQKVNAQAEKEKELGTAAYKKRDFATAAKHYTAAYELVPTNIVYLNNRAAVHFESGAYDLCLEDCAKAVEVGRENRADFKLIAKALSRAGSAAQKQGKLTEALNFFNKSLSEHRNPEVNEKKQLLEKEIELKKKTDYIDVAKSAEARERGNALFKSSDFINAIGEYSEAIKRNPSDAKLYSNRAACYTKILELPLAAKDADECIRLDPTFIKGYQRKATVQIARKDFAAAMETYDKISKLEDPTAKQIAEEGMAQCRQAIMRNHNSNENASEEEIAQRAMADPELREIMADPVMRQILEQMTGDPVAAAAHMKNPEVARKIQKLISAGIIKVR
ncbi:stress-induced-phosphoprotein [Capsaspora owczarzaki ATCC 30864]|uniref:Stress-induced-phosphoprotein n=1 Tax=Capsaspora owczarzaki (strain ATCC 30864) TaxID=595528 RepID=A0A0D2VGU7_CAPO3|nr:stress-induced-phosphoprotein [Capsaspora owczarzaki ATCC 30864]KJE89097.1 stress-induced-phosphoprotein [Capsaspora owczarzaki ATCC 30864]|eukprot:XP_004365516.1 stress-induced-phosphoprotein [Capsaspora owczarzaki ATCC 30864]